MGSVGRFAAPKFRTCRVYEVLHLAELHGVAMPVADMVACGPHKQYKTVGSLTGESCDASDRLRSIVRPIAGQFFDVLSTQI